MTTHANTDVRAFLDFVDGACGASPHTVRAYQSSLAQYTDFLRKRRRTPRTATMDDCIGYAVRIGQSGYAVATRRLRLSAMRRFHAFLHATGRTERDPASLVPSPKRDRGSRPAPSLEAILAARSTLTTPRDRSIFGLLSGSALRISEARLALVDDVDLEQGTITVLGKGRKWRTVELDTFTVWALRDWIPERPRGHLPYLYPSPRAGCQQAMSETPFRLLLRDAAAAAGLNPQIWTPHALRRARGRTLRRVGADPLLIRDVYGHDSIGQTGEYIDDGEARRLPDELKRAIDELETLARLDHSGRDESAPGRCVNRPTA